MAKTILLTLLFAFSLYTQTPTTGRVAGTVKDQNGAVIIGATVTLKGHANAERRTTTTDTDGNFAFSLLSSGIYDVRIDAPGFSTAIVDPIAVSITETISINVTLTVAELAVDTIPILHDALIGTESPARGNTFDSRNVTGLPLATRNFTQFLGLTSGASAYLVDNTTVGRNSQNVSVNGSRVSQNNLQINGVDANAGVGFNRPMPNPAPESVAEIKIHTSPFDATFGRSGGANVQVVTLSGTNEYHGSIYASIRNTGLSANNPFLKAIGLPRPVLERGIYGITLGGPLKKDRSFFFVSYQGTRDRNGASQLNSLSTNVLVGEPPMALTDDRTPATLSSIFGLPESAIHPTALKLLNARLPNGQFVIPTPQLGARYFGSAISHYREEQFNTNFDFRFNQHNLLGVRLFFSSAPETLAREGNDNVPGFSIENTGENLLVSIQDVHSFNADVVNEARVGFSLVRFSNSTQQPFLDSDFYIYRSTASEYPGMPIVRIAPNSGGIGFGTLAVKDAHGSIPTASLADTISATRRSHFIRSGLELRYYGNNLTVPIQTRGNITFQNFRSFLTGVTQTSALANGITDRSMRTSDYNVFLQDDWKILPKFTLNLGLRYELDLPPYDTRGRIATFDPFLYRPPLSAGTLPAAGIVQAGNAIATYDLLDVPNVRKRVLNSNDPNNVAPRIGFTFSPFPKDTFVMRGGYGIFYSRSSFAYLFNNIFFPPFYFATGMGPANFSTPFPTNVPSRDQFPLLVTNSILSGNAFDRNIRTPYVQQFNFGVQLSLAADISFEAAYVGTRGLNLFRQVAINQARLASIESPINGITTNTPGNTQNRATYQGVAVGGAAGTGFVTDQTTAKSAYHSLQLTLTRRFSDGLQFLLSYTFGQSIDNASGTGGGAGTAGLLNVGLNNDSDVIIGNQLDNRANRGLSNFDRRHRFVSSFLWEVPNPSFADRSKFGVLFRDWQISGIVIAMSGLPVDIVDTLAGSFYLGANGGGGRPNWIPGASARNNVPAGYFFNPYAFARPVVQAGQIIPSSNGTAIANAIGTDFGNVERNILRGPRQFNIDLCVGKLIRLTESTRIQLRVEAFNLFNNVNFANPISNFNAVSQSGGTIDPTTGRILNSAGDFGKIISTGNNSRIIQLAVKYTF